MTTTYNSNEADSRYCEVQKFNQPWLWVVVIGCCVLEIGVFGYAIWQQIILDRPWGNQPMSDTGLLIFATLMISLALAMLWLFLVLRLIVVVEVDGLRIRFKPFINRKILWREIAHFESRTYSPLREYGGWGVRGGASGKAYNVSGNQGVQLELKNRERILIGSQRPSELVAAMQQAADRHQSVGQFL